MTQEFLRPGTITPGKHYHDPYTEAGARSIVRRFRDEVIAMLEMMLENRQKFPDGKTMLAMSPLKARPYVAGAMKTLGLVEEKPTRNGSCALTLTDKAMSQIDALKKYL